jgi:hypothetical protein
MKCSCGAEVTKAEIRVVERCARGHFVTSSVAPMHIDRAKVAPKPITPGQRRAFNGKSSILDALMGVPPGTTKRRKLGELGVDSTTLLTETQASDLLDELEGELDKAER